MKKVNIIAMSTTCIGFLSSVDQNNKIIITENLIKCLYQCLYFFCTLIQKDMLENKKDKD